MLHGNVTFSVLNQASNKLSTIENSDWVANLKSNKAMYSTEIQFTFFIKMHGIYVWILTRLGKSGVHDTNDPLPYCLSIFTPFAAIIKVSRLWVMWNPIGGQSSSKRNLCKRVTVMIFPLHGRMVLKLSSIRQKCATLRLEDHFAFGDCIKRL